MQTTTTSKVREQFSSMVIFKDPVSTNSFFAGRNLPSFVKDFVLKRYINKDGSVDRMGLSSFLDMVIPQKQTEVKDRLASGDEQLKKLNQEISEMREMLKEKVGDKADLEESMDSAYSLMHGLLGHDVMNLYDNRKG